MEMISNLHRDREINYEVLSPWADVDPIPLKGNSPWVTDLKSKTIGLYSYYKLCGAVIAREV